MNADEVDRADGKPAPADGRLLTLTGAGGCGKTRLALRMAADVADAYMDGVWLVELAALKDPALVGQVAAQAVGVREVPGRSLADSLVDHLTTFGENTLTRGSHAPQPQPVHSVAAWRPSDVSLSGHVARASAAPTPWRTGPRYVVVAACPAQSASSRSSGRWMRLSPLLRNPTG